MPLQVKRTYKGFFTEELPAMTALLSIITLA